MTFKTINLMTALQELRELRNTIKAAEERITQISDQAIEEALTYTESGQFTHEGHTFQIQQTCTFDFSDYHRYNTPDAAAWREKQREKAELQKKVSALTASMKTIMDNYGVLNDKEPDEVKLTVKVID
jgi:hypothetical protein